MSNFPKLSNEFVKKKFMSDSNLKFVYGQIKKRLCKDKISKKLLESINSDIKQIYAKYTDNDIDELNDYIINFVSERYAPIKKVNDVIDQGILPNVQLPEKNILRGRKLGIKRLGVKTKISRPPPSPLKSAAKSKTKHKGSVPTKHKSRPHTKYDLNVFFADKSTIFKPSQGIYYNPNRNLYFNPKLGVMYDPTKNHYIDTNTGDDVSDTVDRTSFFQRVKSEDSDTESFRSRIDYFDPVKDTTIQTDRVNDHPSPFDVDPKAGSLKIADQYTNAKGATVTEYIINIDSRHRDVRIFPNPSEYTINIQKKNTEQFGYVNNMGDIIKGVTRFELVNGFLPNIFDLTTGQLTDNYMLLAVNEITGRFFNSSPLARNVLGKMKYDLDVNFSATGISRVNYLEICPVEAHRDFYPEPLATSLTSISVRLLNFNGNLFQFGSDSVKIRYWQVGAGNVTIITTWFPHQLTTGDVVYIRHTGNPILDAGVDGVNVLVISPTVFSVPVDSSTVAAGIAPNIGGPPLNPAEPANSAGFPYPTVPPNDPLNPTDFFGFILKPELQNSFTFKIITIDKTRERTDTKKLINIVSGY